MTEPIHRRFVQLGTSGGDQPRLFGLCDDGTAWVLGFHGEWTPVLVPQTSEAEIRERAALIAKRRAEPVIVSADQHASNMRAFNGWRDA